MSKCLELKVVCMWLRDKERVGEVMRENESVMVRECKRKWDKDR